MINLWVVRPLGEPRRKWEDNIKMDLCVQGMRMGSGWSGSLSCPVADFDFTRVEHPASATSVGSSTGVYYRIVGTLAVCWTVSASMEIILRLWLIKRSRGIRLVRVDVRRHCPQHQSTATSLLSVTVATGGHSPLCVLRQHQQETQWPVKVRLG